MARNLGREGSIGKHSSTSSTPRNEALDDADTRTEPKQFLLVRVTCSRFRI